MYRQANYDEKLIFEKDGKRTVKFKEEIGNITLPEPLKRKNLNLADHSETDVVRHYTRLSQMNYGVDIGIYPLGSCTMKYNPKYAEQISGSDKVKYMHPFQDYRTAQGSLEIMYELQEYLKVLGGMDEVTLQPTAGAQGEFTGLSIMRAYHEFNKEIEQRREIIVPDSAHGTNPASAIMTGFEVVEIKSNAEGMVDIESLKSVVSNRTAGLMITNPNTLGIFEEDILEIAKILHNVGALLYYDGANLNAIMGKTTPGKMGFDIVHFNLHKTFATPHGGGGPGDGPVGVKRSLAKFLPVPIIRYDGKQYYFDYNIENSIGKVSGYYGNFAIIVRAWAYIKHMGQNGLKEVTEKAVLNSNYLKQRLLPYFDMPYKSLRKHEFVLSASNLKKYDIRALDIAKRLLDYGVHAPTVYFPLIVEEALMIEPTETENKEDLDNYADIIIKIVDEAKASPELLKEAPHNVTVKRIDEVTASKNPILTWKMYKQ